MDPEEYEAQLSVAIDALPCSLQRLRLTADEPDSASENSDDDAAELPRLPRDFRSLIHLQQLHLTLHSWGVHNLSTG
jgi:hypothetical protein